MSDKADKRVTNAEAGLAIHEQLTRAGFQFVFDTEAQETFTKLPDGRTVSVRGSEFREFMSPYVFDRFQKSLTRELASALVDRCSIEGRKNQVTRPHRVKVEGGDLMLINRQPQNPQADALVFIEKGGEVGAVDDRDRAFWSCSPRSGELPLPDLSTDASLLELFHRLLPVDDTFRRRIILANFIPFQPVGERAHVVHFGPAGHFKTCSQKFLQGLFDPHPKTDGSQIENLISDDGRALRSHLVGKRWIMWSQVSTISRECADLLCACYSGSSVVSRKFYDNKANESFVSNASANLSAVHLPNVQATDFYSRCLLFDHGTISTNERRTEQSLFAEFNELRPQILGAMYRTIASVCPEIGLALKNAAFL